MPTYALPDKMEPRMSTRRGGERAPAMATADEREKTPATEKKAPADKREAPSLAASQSSGSHRSGSHSVGAVHQAKRPKVEHEWEPVPKPPPAAPAVTVSQPLLPICTIAGSGTASFKDGVCEKAGFRGPMAIALAPDGCLVIADSDNRRIRKIHCAPLAATAEMTQAASNANLLKAEEPKPASSIDLACSVPAGAVPVFGSGGAAAVEPSLASGMEAAAGFEGIPAIGGDVSSARSEVKLDAAAKNECGTGTAEAVPLPMPAELVSSSGGDKSTSGCAESSMVPPAVKSGFERVSTLAGNGHPGAHDGAPHQATFFDPSGLAVDPSGNIFVTDAASHTIRRLSPGGDVNTIAGNGKPGNADGRGAAAQFAFPYGIALGPDGQIYVADSGNHKVRVVSPSGDVKTLAGTGSCGFREGSGHSAMFSHPTGIAVDGEGTIFVADRGNHRVRKITSKGTVSTLAGSGQNAVVDGKGAAASFSWPNSIALDPTGRGAIFVSDTFTFRIRKVTRDGTAKTIAIGEAPQASAPKKEEDDSRTNTLLSLTLDARNNFIYIAEQSNNCIRRLSIDAPAVYNRGL